jgi:hypothetical protein
VTRFLASYSAPATKRTSAPAATVAMRDLADDERSVRFGLGAERAAHPVQRRNRAVEIVKPALLDESLRLLTADRRTRKIMIERARQNEIAEDEEDRRQPEPVFPPCALRSPEHCVCDNLRLHRPAHGPRRMFDMNARPVELRRVDRGEFHNRDADRRPLGDQLGAERVGKAADRMFGAAIGRLQRNAAIGERRAHLDDPPRFPRAHRFQRRHRAVDKAEVADLGHSADLGRAHVDDAREHRLHRVVDPNVDRPEPLLEPRGGGEQGVGVGDVDRLGRGLGAEGLELALDLAERRFVARDQADAVAGAGEAPGDRPTDAGGRSCDDDDAAVGAHGSPFRKAIFPLLHRMETVGGMDCSAAARTSILHLLTSIRARALPCG